jgi:hypothetical protein
MKKNSRCMARVWVLALILGLAATPAVFTLDEGGFFETTAERDAWILETLREYPYYVVATGGGLSKSLVPIAIVRVTDESYLPSEDDANFRQLIVVIKNSPGVPLVILSLLLKIKPRRTPRRQT